MCVKIIMEKFKKYLNDKVFLKYLLYSVYIIITVGLLFSLLSQPYVRNFFATIENKTFDVRQSLLSPYKKVNKDIVIISVDEESYEYLFGKYGEWPISRSIYADLITYLEKHKPAAIAFDLMFVKSLKSSNNADNKLADNIAKYDNVFTSINFDNQSFDLRKPVDLPEYLKAKVNNNSKVNFKNEYLDFKNCRAIISQIIDSTPNIGHINIIRENDGIARDLPPFVVYKNDFYPHLALKVAQKYLEKKEGLKLSEYIINKNDELLLGYRKMPLTLNGTAILNWYGPSGMNNQNSFEYIPMWKVEKTMYEGARLIPQNYFQDKIIYIGTSATSLFDLKSVPTDRIFPGVEIHTTFINNILDNNFIKRLPPLCDILISLLLSLFVGLIVIRSESTVISSLIAILTSIIYTITATAVMHWFNLWIGIVLPIVSIILVFIAVYLAKYILKSRDLEYTYALATTDGLTELYNHRYFQEQMLQNIETGKRYNKPFSLIMIDIDFFKKFNDTYGHQSGDAVLRQVAQILKRNVRSTDIVCRYGGEEMAIILTNTNNEEALITAQKICNAVSEHPLKLVNGNDVKVTISLGVSTYPQNGETPADMIKFADECLYKAKEHGRNQVGNLAKDEEG